MYKQTNINENSTFTGEACLVVLVSAVVTIVSAVSMSAICTNGQIKGGKIEKKREKKVWL